MLFIGSFESAKSYVPSIRKSELQEMKGTTVKYKILTIVRDRFVYIKKNVRHTVNDYFPIPMS